MEHDSHSQILMRIKKYNVTLTRFIKRWLICFMARGQNTPIAKLMSGETMAINAGYLQPVTGECG